MGRTRSGQGSPWNGPVAGPGSSDPHLRPRRTSFLCPSLLFILILHEFGPSQIDSVRWVDLGTKGTLIREMQGWEVTVVDCGQGLHRQKGNPIREDSSYGSEGHGWRRIIYRASGLCTRKWRSRESPFKSGKKIGTCNYSGSLFFFSPRQQWSLSHTNISLVHD